MTTHRPSDGTACCHEGDMLLHEIRPTLGYRCLFAFLRFHHRRANAANRSMLKRPPTTARAIFQLATGGGLGGRTNAPGTATKRSFNAFKVDMCS